MVSKVYRGSRKHVLDWTGRSSFLEEFSQFLSISSVMISNAALFMPNGEQAPAEARLETFGPAWLPECPAWHQLQDWWLRHQERANTPNWDIVVSCEIEGRSGLILVEAKANWPELSKAGKPLNADASCNSIDNHEQIGKAISEASDGWRQVDDRISISRDTHYQLANRLAFTWKLASLGIPVVLLYLGFTGDESIRNVGEPFADEIDWQAAFANYLTGVFPPEIFGKRIEIEGTPLWLVSRSRPVIELSPPLIKNDTLKSS